MSNGNVAWYTRCPVPTAFSIALNLGWIDEALADEGFDFRSLATAVDPEVRRSHFTQQARNLFRHGGNIPVLASRARGADVRVIGVSWTTFYEPVLVRPESDLRMVDDLRGRRLGIPRRTDCETDFWRPTVLRGFAQALAVANLTLDDVELVDVPVNRSFLAGARLAPGMRAPLWDAMYMIGQQREEALALLDGRVDAIFSHALLAVNVQGFTGARTLIDVGALPNAASRVNNGTPQVLTVTGDLLDARPDIVARVLGEVIRASQWAAR
ncbi:MAG: ABC transporter substrate-binding protein, partial [Miltoncostaeaceae bacterium]